jgi:hypothetical protein
VVPSLIIFPLMMEAVRSSEASVLTRVTLHHIPEYDFLHLSVFSNSSPFRVFQYVCNEFSMQLKHYFVPNSSHQDIEDKESSSVIAELRPAQPHLRMNTVSITHYVKF